ncbi:Cuticlin-1 [Nymphon striatum]|nr:Cuticlin-1 [Nymphon striatum]
MRTEWNQPFLILIVCLDPNRPGTYGPGESLVSGVNILCNSDNIMVKINTPNLFNGMIYPKGLSKNSSCKAEFTNTGGEVAYRLPLRSCNTMNTDVDDGVEYFNTVVIQPHRKLVTNQGRGYHIRCRYHTKDKTVTSGYNVSQLGTTPLTATAAMPGCTMKIFIGDTETGFIAENVKIGDPLILTIKLDKQDIYGMKITDCLVRDGLNWGEQGLINSEGCPREPEIMGEFQYSEDKTEAKVTFQAHKFPYTASVYYQCNVRLCLKDAGGCDDAPPLCDASGRNILGRRKKRQTQVSSEDDEKDMRLEVFSGFYVSEADEVGPGEEADLVSEPTEDKEGFCVSRKWFVIGMTLAGFLLMIFVLLCVCCLVHRRRRRKDDTPNSSSIYSGPYSNQAYSKN